MQGEVECIALWDTVFLRIWSDCKLHILSPSGILCMQKMHTVTFHSILHAAEIVCIVCHYFIIVATIS